MSSFKDSTRKDFNVSPYLSLILLAQSQKIFPIDSLNFFNTLREKFEFYKKMSKNLKNDPKSSTYIRN